MVRADDLEFARKEDYRQSRHSVVGSPSAEEARCKNADPLNAVLVAEHLSEEKTKQQKKVILWSNHQAAEKIMNDQQRRTSLATNDSRRASITTIMTRRSSLASVMSGQPLAEQQKKKSGWFDSCCCSCCCFCCKALSSVGDSKVGMKEDDSDSDLSKEEDVIATNLRRSSAVSFRLNRVQLNAIRLRVLEKLGVPEDEEAPWGFWLRLQRLLGILELRTIIGVKRIRVEEEPPKYPSARALVCSLRFEAVVAVLILINASMIGWDAMFLAGEDKPWPLLLSEGIFTFLFLLEFILRIMAFSWVWIFDPMNVFDAFVVWIVGVLTTYILIPFGAPVDVVQRLAALRILRLARLCRAVRMIPVFHELWMLVKGVIECMSLLFWAGVIIGTVHFMFAVATLELVVKTETFANDPLVEEYFGGLMPAMFTLFQIMTFDSWAAILRPMFYAEPATAVLFFFFMGIAGIVLFNLMTAIVVKNSFDAITEDEEAMAQLKHIEHTKMMRELRDMFLEMDEDKSGLLSQAEFTDVLDDVMFVRKIKMMDIDLDELPDIFSVLDDGDGQVSMDEFCTGLMRMQGTAMSRDTLRAAQRLKRLNENFSEISQDMEDYSEMTFDSIETSLNTSHQHFLEIQALTAEVLKQLNQVGIRKVVQETTPDLPKLSDPTLKDVQEERKRALKEKPPDVWAAPKSEEQLAAAQGTCLAPIPPAWVARRKEEERKAKREKNKRMVRSRHKKQPVEEPKEEELAGGAAVEFQEEWSKLEVQIEVPQLQSTTSSLRLAAGGPLKRKEAPSLSLTLPGGLVPPVSAPGQRPVPIGAPLPAAPPPPLPEAEDHANHPNAVPQEQDDGMTIV